MSTTQLLAVVSLNVVQQIDLFVVCLHSHFNMNLFSSVIFLLARKRTVLCINNKCINHKCECTISPLAQTAFVKKKITLGVNK